MKRFVLFLFAIFVCHFSHAQTETINWYVGGNVYTTTTCESGNDIILPATPTKLGYTFQGWVDYIPIEYLEFTGTQYIDPNITIKGTSKFEFDVQSSNTTNLQIIGSGGSTDKGLVSVRKGDNLEYFTFWRNSKPYTPGNILVDTQRHLFVQDIYNNIVRIDQHVETIPDVWSGTAYKIYIGAYSKQGTANTTYGWTGKYYSVKFYENNTLVRDFIPALDYNETPCMYERVEGKFYYNAGTGNFIAGPAI